MSANDQITEKRKIKVMDIIFLSAALLNFVFGIHAFVTYCHIWPKLLHVGDKLNQTGVDALIRMEKDFALVALGISIALIVNSIMMIGFFLKKIKPKKNL